MADSSLQTLDTSQGSPKPAELFRTRTGFRSRGSALSSVTEGGNLGNLGRSYNQSHTKAPEFIRWTSQRGDFTALHPQREQPCCHPKVLLFSRSTSPLLSGLDQLKSSGLKLRPWSQSMTRNTATVSSLAHSP